LAAVQIKQNVNMFPFIKKANVKSGCCFEKPRNTKSV